MGRASGAAADFLARRAAPAASAMRAVARGRSPAAIVGGARARQPGPASWYSRCWDPQMLAAAPGCARRTARLGGASELERGAAAYHGGRCAALGDSVRPCLLSDAAAAEPADARCGAWAAHSAQWRDSFALERPGARPRNMPRLPRRSLRRFNPSAVVFEGHAYAVFLRCYRAEHCTGWRSSGYARNGAIPSRG